MRRRENTFLVCASPGTDDRGGALRRGKHQPKVVISRCLHLINIRALEVQMVAKDGHRAQYGPHPIAIGLVIGQDLTHTSFQGRSPVRGIHRWESAFPLKLAFAIDCVAKSAPLSLLSESKALVWGGLEPKEEVGQRQPRARFTGGPPRSQAMSRRAHMQPPQRAHCRHSGRCARDIAHLFWASRTLCVGACAVFPVSKSRGSPAPLCAKYSVIQASP